MCESSQLPPLQYATTGAGVFETLKGIAREVLLDLRKRKTRGSLRPASAAR